MNSKLRDFQRAFQPAATALRDKHEGEELKEKLLALSESTRRGCKDVPPLYNVQCLHNFLNNELCDDGGCVCIGHPAIRDWC